MVPFSVLDLSPIFVGGSPRSFRNTLDLARHAERLGYAATGSPSTTTCPASPAPPRRCVIGHVAGGTSTIRVGSGGIMLPNHAPLVIAEQFGTLESLYPGRIDLGLGRAPGTDPPHARALRRYSRRQRRHVSPRTWSSCTPISRRRSPGQAVRAVPGAGLDVPIWLLGSSLFSAQLAAVLGLPFAFASHFAPDLLMPALEVYRATSGRRRSSSDPM